MSGPRCVTPPPMGHRGDEYDADDFSLLTHGLTASSRHQTPARNFSGITDTAVDVDGADAYPLFASDGASAPYKSPASALLSPDRHIPAARTPLEEEMSRFVLTTRENLPPAVAALANGSLSSGSSSPAVSRALFSAEEPYAATLAKCLFNVDMSRGILGLRPAAATPTWEELPSFNSCPGVVYAENKARHFQSKTFRVIPQTPERILDAPELLDDFYLNLIDWSSRNVLSVALSQTVYLWNADNGEIQQLLTIDDAEHIVTSVGWQADGCQLAVGNDNSEVEIWDAIAMKRVQVIRGHSGRVGSVAWNGSILASGSRDASIMLCDVRSPQRIGMLQGHTQEVCGLKWSPNNLQLASGGNDNLLCVWDFNRHAMECKPTLQLRHHTAAVKALAWNPVHSGLLVSGGGTADKTLRFWNTHIGACTHVIDTKSQVCAALWSRDGTELVSSHGYSDNQLTLWKYPSLKRITDLTGHNSRVLHLAISPDGQIVVSAAGDETIRFWRCFASDQKKRLQLRRGRDESATTSTLAGASARSGNACGGFNERIR
jgi:cell division cycle protein 20 (cofactor of APC complex)